jgi:hypothetical protein
MVGTAGAFEFVAGGRRRTSRAVGAARGRPVFVRPPRAVTG